MEAQLSPEGQSRAAMESQMRKLENWRLGACCGRAQPVRRPNSLMAMWKHRRLDKGKF